MSGTIHPKPSQILSLLVFLGPIFLISCSSTLKTAPRANLLMADEQGRPLAPEKPYPTLDLKKFDRYIDNIFASMGTFCADKRPCKIMMFFHGGLNTHDDSVARAADLTDQIRGDETFPIFLSWDSSLPAAWWDHVAHVHEGLWTGKSLVAASPYFAAVDEVQGLSEAPSAWAAEIRHTFPTWFRSGETNRNAEKSYAEIVDHPESISITKGISFDKYHQARDDRHLSQVAAPIALLPLTIWGKIFLPPLVIQGPGTGAWDMMRRRTAMLLRTEAEMRGISPKELKAHRDSNKALADPRKLANSPLSQDQDTIATLRHFIDRYQKDFLTSFCGDKTDRPKAEAPEAEVLQSATDVKPCNDPVELTLVGHSMGTIVIDRLLRYSPNLPVKNIVFMAAATTVEDYRDTINSYLELHPDRVEGGKRQQGTGTQMYHLILHPTADISESNFFDLTPRGSLLVWIDSLFTTPTTPQERTAGRFVNLLPELHYAPESTRPQVHVKIFRFGKTLRCWNPQIHGDFGAFPFWRPAFWDPATPTDQTSPFTRLDRNGCPASAAKAESAETRAGSRGDSSAP